VIDDFSGAAVVRLADNGPGVAHEAARRVFAPFYTTRQEQGQLGMGPYIVSHLVPHILSGRIFVVHSEEGFVLQLELPA